MSSLKKYKRGLLSAIFERRIRFKDDDGSKFPEWEQKKLISCCNGFDNLRQPITANLRRKGKYPYYGANGIQDYVDDYIFDGEYIPVSYTHLQYQQNDEVADCHPIPPPACENLPPAAFTQLWVSHFRRHPFSLFKRETERKDGENKWQSIIWKQK